MTGQLEKGAEGTPHVQFFLHFAKNKRIPALKKHCKQAHFEVVKVNNGADDYCNKEDTRLEGPWSYGIKPARNNRKGEVAARNMEIIEMGVVNAV